MRLAIRLIGSDADCNMPKLKELYIILGDSKSNLWRTATQHSNDFIAMNNADDFASAMNANHLRAIARPS